CRKIPPSAFPQSTTTVVSGNLRLDCPAGTHVSSCVCPFQRFRSRCHDGRCAERIVPNGTKYDADALERIVEKVYARRQSIRRLIDAFRQSSRNPFPNWKEN